MKFLSLYSHLKPKDVIAGVIVGISAFVLCICLAIIAIVYSPSVYISAYQKGCIDADYYVDSDNYVAYYTTLTEFLATSDTEVLNSATFKVNNEISNMFTDSDVVLLQPAASFFNAVRYIAAFSGIVTVAVLLIGFIKKGKLGLSKISACALPAFLICVVSLFLFLYISHLSGHDISYLLFNIFTLKGLSSHTFGFLNLFYGTVTMQVFTDAFLKISGLFCVIMLIIILSLCNVAFKKKKDDNEDFMYQ